MSQLVEVLWNYGLLENRDFTLIKDEAHGLKMYRGDVEDLLKEVSGLEYRLLRVEVSDDEDSQMDLLAVELFFKEKR